MTKPKRPAAKKVDGSAAALAAKPVGRPKRKSKISVAKIAEMRRKGATWAEVVEATGLKLKSTGFAHLLAESGYDRAGRKGGQGASKATAFGPSLLDR
ncbi:MAG: hypothetical protein ACRDMH_00360 [Solirubrobacterales bacterium]